MIALKSKIRAYFGSIAKADCLVWFLRIKLLQISSRSTCCSRWVCSTAIWLSLFWVTVDRIKVFRSLKEENFAQLYSSLLVTLGIIVAGWQLLAATVPSWCFLWTTAQRQQHQSVVRQSNIDIQASPSEDASVACQCLFRSWLWLVTNHTLAR